MFGNLGFNKRLFRRWWPVAVLLFGLALWFSIWWLGPSPPRQITIATGEPGGTYAELGRQYKEILEKKGIAVTLVNTQGSRENLALLQKNDNWVVMAQAGMAEEANSAAGQPSLRALAALQWEPVWVFYRRSILPPGTQDGPGWQKSLYGLFQGKKIAIGQENSGTAQVARAILEVNGLTEGKAHLVHRTMEEAAADLQAGRVDAAFTVSGTQNSQVLKLIKNEQIQLHSFGRALAYSRLFPYLSPVTLGEGVIDLKNNLPTRDIQMFALPTLLVCREDLHPKLVEQLLIAGKEIHSPRDILSGPKNFPSLDGLSLPLHDTAQVYIQSGGASLISQILPYWGVVLFFRLRVLILPLLIVWLPFFRLVPLLYNFRVNWLLRRHYAVLRDIEDRIEKAPRPEELRDKIGELESLRKNMEKLSRKIPTHLQINVYQWRMHVSHVLVEAREALRRLEEKTNRAKDSATQPGLTEGG